MTTYLYIDTETSDYHEAVTPAHPVELAAILAEEHRVVSVVCVLISQTDWVGMRVNPIAERVVRNHGITPALCAAYGWPPDVVYLALRRLAARAGVVVGHNLAFDTSVVDASLERQCLPPMDWPTERFCTMRESAPIVQLPGTGWYDIGGFKAPKLAEAYRHFVGTEMRGAHGALADAYAARAVHRGIMRYRAKGQEAAINV